MPRTVTADRPLTVKQTKFAAEVAAGKPKAAARREHYSTDPKYAMANARRASELAQQPHVAAEIRRLTWLSCPPLDDIRGMREHAVRIIADLTRSADSDAVKLNAALALYKIAETARAAASPAASTQEQDKLLERLRSLYHGIQAQAAKLPGATAAAPPARRPKPGPLDTFDVPVVPYDDEPIDVTTLAEPAPPEAVQQPAQAPETPAPRWDQVSANSNISPQPAPAGPAEPPPAPPEEPPENIL